MFLFFFKQKTAYEMRISDWSSDVCSSGLFPCGLTGQKGYPIEDVTFSNIFVQSAGGGTAADAARVPEERPTSSLEVSYLRTLPAQGLYARHAERLTVRGVEFVVDKPDARPL